MTDGWVTTAEFARLARLTPQMARKAFRRALGGSPWNGHHLEIHVTSGNRSRGGLLYFATSESVARALGMRMAEPATQTLAMQTVTPTAEFADTAQWQRRYAIVAPALTLSGTTRAACVRELAASHGVSERTLRRWIAAHEAKGLVGLQRQTRADRGRRRVVISQAWDQGVPLAKQDKARIAAALRRHVRSLWAGPLTFAGYRRIRDHASDKLRELTRAEAPQLSEADLLRLCRVPRPFVDRERQYREVGVYDRDRKDWFDRSQPRIGRKIDGMLPMQCVIGDVHPADIHYLHHDGSTIRIRLITWLDVATGRLFVHPVFLTKGQGIRQEHAIEAFVAIVLDTAWGMPGSLYLDNGGEYNWASFIGDAMKLAMPISFAEDGSFRPAAGSMITKAMAYNAPAKGAIEGAFANLERRFLSLLPGWIGGDRMLKKTANVGKPPAAYPGAPHELARDILNAVRNYNETAQHGRLKGESPNDALRRFITEGWTRTEARIEHLIGAFCRVKSAVVRKGTFRYLGTRYFHDALAGIAGGTSVELRIPLFGQERRILVLNDRGEHICVAEPDNEHPHDDRGGAKESGRRVKIARQAIAAMKRDIDPIDGRELLARPLPPEPVAPIGGVIRMADDVRRAGRALAKPAAERRSEARSQAQKQKQEWMGAAKRIGIMREAG